MKTELLIRIGIGVGGAAAGSLITWLCIRSHYNRKAEKEISEAREFYSNVKIRDYIREATPEEKEAAKKEASNKPSEPTRASTNAPVIDYTKFYNKSRVDDAEDPAESESPPEGVLDEEEMKELDRYLDGHKMTTDAMENVGIYLISKDSYDNDFLQYSKETLFYYTTDEVLTTEEEEVIDNEEAVVGSCLDDSGIRYGDIEGSIYIRNADLGADYEVQKIIGSFR